MITNNKNTLHHEKTVKLQLGDPAATEKFYIVKSDISSNN